uniref:Uncharacterized protein n=1 Tax=Panagrolaimus superbus TaxID=310955 RepID=A0A914YVR5_9BILA
MMLIEQKKRSQLWKANVSKYAIISANKIRELLLEYDNDAVQVAALLDGAAIFGHCLEPLNAAEFAQIRANMRQF